MNVFAKLASSQTLQARVTHNIFVLTLVSLFVFGATTLFILYSFEDAVFKQQLQQAESHYTQSKTLPAGVEWLADLSRFELSPAQQYKYIESSEQGYGEFGFGGKHYHYLQIEQGMLLLDTTDIGLVRRALDDIVLILLLASVPAVVLTFWIAKRISNHAIRPFNQVSQMFVAKDFRLEQAQKASENIKETDLRHMAMQWVESLQHKADGLEREIAFNQGMAHELRTPLQVMTHSVELLQNLQPELQTLPAFLRLDKSINRMKRLSDGLLWLTAERESSQQTQVRPCLQSVLDESQKLLETHQIKVNLSGESSPALAMPEVVFELIVLNLLTNVIHHCQVPQEQKCWNIDIQASGIEFCNPVATTGALENTESRFGLGLSLVEKLAAKFDLKMQINQHKGQFCLRLFT